MNVDSFEIAESFIHAKFRYILSLPVENQYCDGRKKPEQKQQTFNFCFYIAIDCAKHIQIMPFHIVNNCV